ncbi:MAG: glycosyltransferase family 4 protein [Desulfococcaceae bacterium]|jgi:glycosyltransferase involved in cell wall biosynthesis|nr:glycosyltransferase family 4 protein [Desulfococcaceae bacterium]
MHILLIHQAFVSPKEPGGTRHYELARHLIKKGHKVTIIASNLSYLTGKRTASDSGFISEEIIDGIKVLRVYTYPTLHRSFVWRVVSFFSFMFSSLFTAVRVQNVDLIMGTSPPIFQLVSAWLAAKVHRKLFLLEIRDLWPEFAIDMGVLKNPVLIRLSRRLELFLYSQADHFLVNSPAYKDYLINKDILENKITLIPNGVDTTVFKPEMKSENIRKKYNLKDQFVVTYTGALGLANDIQTILRAAKRLTDKPDIRFLIVGDGKERSNLEKLAKEWNLTNVIFTGSLSKSEMPEILAASDACLATLQDIPMFRTTYPNKIFDYMAAGRPTILAIDGVIRKVIESANGGIFVHPGDDESLANAILKLRNDENLVKSMGLAARNYVEKYFDRYKHAEQFAELIRTIGCP